MKKTSIFDFVFILLAVMFLILMNKFGNENTLNTFLLIPLLIAYYMGRYVTVLSAKKKS